MKLVRYTWHPGLRVRCGGAADSTLPYTGAAVVAEDRSLNTPTLRPDQPRSQIGDELTCLSIVWHPDVRRVGSCAFLGLDRDGETVALSRLEPNFIRLRPPGQAGIPLGDPAVSRRPIELAMRGDQLVVRCDPAGSALTVDQQPVNGSIAVDRAAIERGIVLILAERIALLLHRRPLPRPELDDCDVIGSSPAADRLRAAIERAAHSSAPTLVCGDSGVGKTRVARAIHARSARASGPFVKANMASLASKTAAVQLFGRAAGMPSGTIRGKRGFFTQAEGGTLLLDDIGETTIDVQAMVLRAIETRQIHMAGADTPVKIDVRVIAASDSELEPAARAGRFRAALLASLSGESVAVPPLCERREDIAPLLIDILSDELRRAGQPDHLAERAPEAPMWLHPDLVAHLLRYHWPGNIRELRSVARHMVAANRDGTVIQLDPLLQNLIGIHTHTSPAG
ncbi:MAG: sigma 54-interacting transcriptional regulator [Myxococcota bacterium]